LHRPVQSKNSDEFFFSSNIAPLSSSEIEEF